MQLGLKEKNKYSQYTGEAPVKKTLDKKSKQKQQGMWKDE